MKKETTRRIAIALTLVLALGIIAGCGSTSTTDKSTTKDSSGKSKTAEPKEKFTLEDGHTGSVGAYNVGYNIEGTIKNNTDKKYAYVQVTFNLYDAENNSIGTALANINNLDPNGTWKFKAVGLVSDGTTVASYKLGEITGY